MFRRNEDASGSRKIGTDGNNLKVTPTHRLAARVGYAAMNVLKQNGGALQSRDVASKVEKMLTFNEWEQEVTDKAGKTRWESKLHSYTSLYTKAGMLIKNRGLWELTPAGKKA